MHGGLAYLNDQHNNFRLGGRNDIAPSPRYYGEMARPSQDWYAAEWLAHYGKKQADMVRDLDWNKSRASLMVRGIQPYDRDSVNELAIYLNLEPFELLLPPARAMALRRYRESAAEVVNFGAVKSVRTDMDEPGRKKA
jgi:hypothetical protein